MVLGVPLGSADGTTPGNTLCNNDGALIGSKLGTTVESTDGTTLVTEEGSWILKVTTK